jgi:uncharacterized BrkB/YihY/UPF0761 family membrane protein
LRASGVIRTVELGTRDTSWTTMKGFVAGVVPIWLALGLIALLMLRGATFQQVTDQSIEASAPEDILGYGFAFEWVPLTVVEMLLLAWAYRVGGKRRKLIAFIGLGVYLTVSVVVWMEYETLARRVLG